MADRDPIVGPLEVQLGAYGSRVIGVNGQYRMVARQAGRRWKLSFVEIQTEKEAPVGAFQSEFALESFCHLLKLARAELLKPEMANG